MKKQTLVFFVLMFLWSASIYAEELLFDNFDDGSIDTTKWTQIGGDGVFEQNGILQVETNTTDNAGYIYSKWIDIDPEVPLTITTRSKVHYGNNYFQGQFNIELEGVPEFTFGAKYSQYSYQSSRESPAYGFYLFRNAASPHITLQLPDVYRIDPIWDTWIDETFTYDPRTGVLEYFINSQKKAEFNVGALPKLNSYRIRISMVPWGWWTGHYQHYDEISIQGGSTPGDGGYNCNDLGMTGVLASGLDVGKLQVGDILLALSPYWEGVLAIPRMVGGTYWFHAAIYLGNGKIAHAKGSDYPPEEQVAVDDLSTYWGRADITDWAIIRPKTTSSVKCEAAKYAYNKAEQTSPSVLYNNEFFSLDNRDREDAFYCSALPWKSYQKQGVDLEPDLLKLGFSPLTVLQDSILVTPDDLYYSASNKIGKSTLVAQKLGGGGVKILRVYYKMFSPADILVTDELGRRTGYNPETDEFLLDIPGTHYTGPDAEPETLSITGVIGDLEIRIIGNDYGSYTFEAINYDVLEPSSQYINRETGPDQLDIFTINGNQPEELVLQVEIDVKPQSKNNCVKINGRGVIPVAIFGQQGFDVYDIMMESLSFGGMKVGVRGTKGPLCTVGYVNEDDMEDLMCHFEDDSYNWSVGNGTSNVSGMLIDGTKFMGRDTICVVPSTRTMESEAMARSPR